MPPATELLVHISAPCGASDDARYRKEAQEYLRFKATTWRPLCWPASDIAAIDGTEAALPVVLEAAPPIAEDNDTDYTNVDLSSLKTPGRIPRNLLKIHVVQTPIGSRPQTAPSSTKCVNETPFIRCRSQSVSGEQLSSLVPDSQPSLPLAIPHYKRRYISRSPSQNSLANSPSPKRRRINFSLGEGLAVKGKPLPHLQEKKFNPKNFILSRTLRSIIAPPPQPSIESFKTYVTPPLALITNHLPLPTFYISYQAQPQLRPLQIHERGHWALSISSFTAEHKTKVWAYLEKFIGAGRAGIVSCFLEEAKENLVEEKNGMPATARAIEACEARNKVPPGEVEGGKGKEEFLKLFCMGEAVPSIWLLLFIATTRQVKGCRAQWIDASGTVVVQMQ